jgi:hypothetical protein
MPTAEQLMRLFPRAWRERYGEEFLATVGSDALRLQQVIDIVSGAIDAWLSADVRRAATAGHVAANGQGHTMLKSMMVCERKRLRATTRDSLIGAGVMIGATMMLSLLGISAKRGGWVEMGDVLLTVGYPAALTLSMPFWLMKGQPWKAQAVIVGGMMALLIAISYVASLL